MSEPLRLLLLRHAHAEPAAPGQSDLERPLSATGEAEAEAAASWLAGRGWPARALCSPARRTRQTLARLLDRSGYLDTREEPAIYEASPGTLIEVIERHRGAGSLLVVGHNPGLECLVALLCSGRSGDARGMPPAAIAEIELPQDAPIEPGRGRLVAFWWP